jgi:hypothetical protein
MTAWALDLLLPRAEPALATIATDLVVAIVGIEAQELRAAAEAHTGQRPN